MMRACQRQRIHLWESLREWLLVPPFTHAFLKSPSSRGLSVIAELLVNDLTGMQVYAVDAQSCKYVWKSRNFDKNANRTNMCARGSSLVQ